MHPGGWVLAVILFLVGSSVRPQSSQTPPSQAKSDSSVISVTTDLVVLPVKATDAHGDFVPGLTREAFRVYEDKRLQSVTLFQQEDAPVSVGLVVDHSSSMRSKLPDVVTAVSAFARSSNPRDEMFVVDFADQVSVELLSGKVFSSDPMEIEKAVGAVDARGRTALYDAVAEGLVHLQLAHWRKTALIIVSDGGDNESQHKYREILALARRSQAVIYAVGLVDESGEEENPKVLEQLSKDTGGMAFFPRATNSVADAMAAIARDLREQYTLGYVPGNRSGASFRRIRVEVMDPGREKIQVRTRPGYFPASQNQETPQPQSTTP
jgi:VWFA-related protein